MGEFVPASLDSQLYMGSEPFWHCVIDEVRGCARRVVGNARTVYRSFVRVLCGLALVLGCIWMFYVRNFLKHTPETNLAREVSVSLGQVLRIKKKPAEVARILLSSRITLGLALAFVLQLSFTIWIHQVATPYLDDHPSPYNGIAHAAIVIQFVIVMLAVVYNIILYLKLRDQILQLPAAVFFGEEEEHKSFKFHNRRPFGAKYEEETGVITKLEDGLAKDWLVEVGWHIVKVDGQPFSAELLQAKRDGNLPYDVVFLRDVEIPTWYKGPDLRELREMGSTSLLFAAWFPGLAFWRFFFSAWLLTLLLSSIQVVFKIVGADGAAETERGRSTWYHLCEAIFIGSVLTAHYFTRLFVQQCLFTYRDIDLQFRCFCLWSWWEAISCLFGLAVGPFSTFLDYLKGLLSTMVAGLILQKPNFVQFGELTDYVYCTYCACLYLERVAEDKHKAQQLTNSVGSDEESSAPCETLDLDTFDADYEAQEKNALILEEAQYRYLCPARCLGCLCAFGGTPILVGIILNVIGASMNYPCETKMWFLPLEWCPGNTSAAEHH